MKKTLFMLLSVLVFYSCGTGGSKKESSGTGTDQGSLVQLITVDPGHFHAALVQKKMYGQVSPDVYVYAPEGPDYLQHLDRIKSYNERQDDPTSWNEIVYTGDDFFARMLEERKGNVVVLSGNNGKKAEYITRSVNAGLNVLADKPMIISPDDFPALKDAFRVAGEKGILLYDIMTERYEVTTILQKLLSQNSDLFGTLVPGSKEDPAVTKLSVHHFSKIVSGSPLLRPAWFFDVAQQGEGIVDVTTHLVDLVQWECFPEQVLNVDDVNLVSARRWPTVMSKEEFSGVTGFDEFPDYLMKDVKDGKLNVFANGEIVYQLKGVWAKVSVEWKYQAPEGTGDTHYSIMRGTKCDLSIRQGAEENYLPTLYAGNVKGMAMDEFRVKLEEALKALPYDSLEVVEAANDMLKIVIPGKYRVTHEEHFGQVTEKFLEYMKQGSLPEWEVAGMITKYHTTTGALRMATMQK
ncbi:MAG: putative oxidoreductase C-terminal domain-containing protein [Bacteroidales bacterium]|jgi:predicted dehydrogenase|nr:putative oxidoreductase C-terminal domain-containing protein [Bacteroidales bacterium]